MRSYPIPHHVCCRSLHISQEQCVMVQKGIHSDCGDKFQTGVFPRLHPISARIVQVDPNWMYINFSPYCKGLKAQIKHNHMNISTCRVVPFHR